MAQKSKPRTPRKSSYRGFEGVNLIKTHSGDESISLIDNLRITDDGSLKKRCGFKKIYENKVNVSSASVSYSREENGEEVCYFTQGYYVKRYNSSTQTVTNIGRIRDDSVNIFFFEYINSLYICDGEELYLIKDNSLYITNFYIPLYGKEWSNFGGEMNEAPNLLHPKIAISYKLTSNPASYLYLNELTVKSVDAVYRNGVPVAKDTYHIDTAYNAIAVSEFEEGDLFFVILTISPDNNYTNQKNALFNSTHATLFPEISNNNIFFWGSDFSNSVFYSASINEKNAKITDKYATNTRFYIPVNSYFSVGSDADRVKSLIRHYDRVLIMTDSSTWITNLQDLESNSLKLKNINASIGCTVKNGCVRIENTIFSIGKDAIYAWSNDTDELNECNAHSISEPIKDLLNKDFFKSSLIHLNYGKREIWFYSPSQAKTWIYNYACKAWYSFSGFTPTAFLEGGDEVRFLEERALYVFSPELNADIRDDNEVEIIARLKSGELEFNSEQKKKLSSATVRGAFSGGALTLNVLLDGQTKIVYSITPSKSHSVIPFRTKSGSFRALSFELVASGKAEQIIHGIELNAD